MSLLTPEEIGDNLDLEIEAEYPCSDGSSVMTVSVDKLLQAQHTKDHTPDPELREKLFDLFMKSDLRDSRGGHVAWINGIIDQILDLEEEKE